MVKLEVLGGTNQWSDDVVVSTTSGVLLLLVDTKVVTHGLPLLAAFNTVSSHTVVVFTLVLLLPLACTVGPSMSRPRKVLVVVGAAAAAEMPARTATPLGQLGGTRP
jgi:hypothetical protein